VVEAFTRDQQRAAHQRQGTGDHQHQVADQAELLREDGEDEVRRALGDELQVRLRALHPALAEGTAGADGDRRCSVWKPLPSGSVVGSISVSTRAALVVVHHRPR